MNIFHFLHELQLCARRQSTAAAGKLHSQIIKAGLGKASPLTNTLLDVYGKCGLIPQALQLFDEMPHRDHVSWASILTAHNRAILPRRTLSMLSIMFTHDGLQPDHFVFACIVSACASLGYLRLGKQVHARFMLSSFCDDEVVKSSLIDMYAKCGMPDDARAVFDSILFKNSVSWTAMISGYAKSGRKSDAIELFQRVPVRNLFSWTALISGLIQIGTAQHGKAEEALSLYDEMVLSGIKPNEVTFVGLLYACSHVGLVTKGRELFRSMTADYKINPSLQHYTCLLDLLSRSGHLEEAENLLNKMPFKPDEPTWASLLSACKRHNNMEMGVRIADHVLDLKPKDPSTYILLSNVYAGAEMWESVSKVRRLMSCMEVRKEPGYSSIDFGKESQVFHAGETNHPMKDEIFHLLKDLDAEMRRRGYVPNTSFVLHDMEQQEKEKQLFWHSERLAMAYGLLKAVPGTVIRIVKNLRICGDCHNVLKFTSDIVKREIVVRDATRYHHFKDGKCSCNDFW
ncbi:Pentatricopeptide repeat-containing protein, mitochondrial, partial [Cucurbita argyrosperma subsp. argyrosperma]